MESVAKSSSFRTLFETVLKHEGSSISYTAKRGLLKSFIIIGESFSSESQDNYWDQVSNFYFVISINRENFKYTTLVFVN